MPISEEVVNRLVHNGIDVVFGIPGTQTLPLNEAIENRDDIRYVMARHETAVSHQAWGYAETTGHPAATVVVPGPGDMNAMNGLKNALNDCTPLVHISIETEPEVRGGDGIHETPPDTYENVVKENIVVENAEGTVAAVDRAVALATTAPHGPVRLGIPKNFLVADRPTAAAGDIEGETVTDVPSDAVAEAAALLSASDRPIVVAGGGVRSAAASRELAAVAELVGAPVVTTVKGKGVFPEDHPLFAGVMCGGSSQELRDCLASSDAALAVGTDLDAVSTVRWSMSLPERLVHVTLDESDIGTGYDATVGIVADAADSLAAIEAVLPDDHPPAGGEARASAVRDAEASRMESLRSRQEAPLTSVSVIDAVRTALPRDGIVTADAGGYRIWTLLAFEAYGPRRYVNCGSWASMGLGYPSAIGAQVGNPDVPVVSLMGDGGLMMCIHELHTAVAEEIPVTVVVLRNNDYAVISDQAVNNFDLEPGEYDWGDSPIDFATVADGMGMDAVTVTTWAALRDAVSEAAASDDPTLIQVPTDPQEPQASTWMVE